MKKGSGIWGRRNLKSWFSLFKKKKKKKEKNKKVITSTPGRKLRSRELKFCRFSVQAFQEEKQTQPHTGAGQLPEKLSFPPLLPPSLYLLGNMTSQTHICMLRKYLQRYPYSRLTCNCCSEKEENVFLFLSPFSELFADISGFLICRG